MKSDCLKSNMIVFLLIALSSLLYAQSVGWYTEGNFAPAQRLKIIIENALDFDRKDCPVVISREEFPVKKLHEMWVTVVDPALPSKPEPAKEELAFAGGHGIRQETNGHQIYYQIDDLDKDGIWDELFFQTDIKAKESKTLYIYFGFSGRGWNPHGTHATIGSYCRHIIPWWESENIGWKLWFPTSVDMYGKRKSVLMSEQMCVNNYCGYQGIPKVNWDFGSDIMRVSNSFGAGGIGLFEFPNRPDTVSTPRFVPYEGEKISEENFNEDQLSSTRYAFDVVVNGPMRSIIRVKTMNWNSGSGYYELTQDYTAYTRQNYSTCKVKFSKFFPIRNGVTFAAGIRSGAEEYFSENGNGFVIRAATDLAADPDDDTGQKGHKVEFIGTALVVKDKFHPEYRKIKSMGGNHLFSIPVTNDLSYEYLIAGSWNEGVVYNTKESFINYVKKTAKEYNSPLKINYGTVENK